MCSGIVTSSLAKVAISEIIQREDQTLNLKISSTNKLLTKLGSKYDCANYLAYLNAPGLPLNITGTAILAKNYVGFLKH